MAATLKLTSSTGKTFAHTGQVLYVYKINSFPSPISGADWLTTAEYANLTLIGQSAAFDSYTTSQIISIPLTEGHTAMAVSTKELVLATSYGPSPIWNDVYLFGHLGATLDESGTIYSPTKSRVVESVHFDTYSLMLSGSSTSVHSDGSVAQAGQKYQVSGSTGYFGFVTYLEFSTYVPPEPGVAPGAPEFHQIRPAPEPLPHRISLQDTKGNMTLQRKLQDNFDAIERQLLALEPDRNTNDPNWR